MAHEIRPALGARGFAIIQTFFTILENFEEIFLEKIKQMLKNVCIVADPRALTRGPADVRRRHRRLR